MSNKDNKKKTLSVVTEPDTHQAPVASVEVEAKVEESESVRPSRRLLQTGEYWAKWSSEWIDELKEELMDVPPRQMSEEERALTFTDRMQTVQIVKQSYASNYVKRKILNHELPSDDVEALQSVTTKCIVNNSDKSVYLNPSSGGTGFTTCWFPPKSTSERGVDFTPARRLTAYEENFIDQSAVEAAGLQMVDFDPRDPSHTGDIGGASSGGGYDVSVNREKALAKLDAEDGISPAERQRMGRFDGIHQEHDEIHEQIKRQQKGAPMVI